MRMIKLTHSVTEKGIYVDFDKVTDIIEPKSKGYTVIWCDTTQYIPVKESPEQIAKLVKRARRFNYECK